MLVHSGGAYGGHYYAYISDGENWFKFDDSTITQVSRHEMRKYGSNAGNTHGANAYLLFYRDVKHYTNTGSIAIPEELLEKIKR